jgi:peptidoglycan/LPS O-acetylase OafA/YrhL
MSMLQLRRITTGASWIPQIDGLRFVAIVSVLLFHVLGEVAERGPRLLVLPESSGWWVRLVDNGDRGVWVFFVISGYILSRPFLRQYRLKGHEVKLGPYFLRRVTRLEPPYVLSLLLYTAASCIFFHVSLMERLPHLVASIFYVHNLIYDGTGAVSYVAWTLEIEVQFYLMAPLLGNLYRIENTALRRGIIVLLMLASGAGSLFVSPPLQATMLYYAQYFFAGFLLADLLDYPRHANRQSWGWDLVSVAGWPLIFWLPRVAATEAWLPLLIVPVFVAAFYGKASNWFFRQPVIALTGGMCYSIYLTHMLFISLFFRAVKHLQMGGDELTVLVQMVAVLIPMLAACTGYYLLIERPCMDPKWPQKLWHHLRAATGRIPGESAEA